MSESVQEKLKPCPFCGGAAVQLISGSPGGHYARCDGCLASSDDRTRDSAIAAWNRRTSAAAERELWEENRKLWDINWNLGEQCLPAHIDLLEAVADEIDCEQDCEHGHTEWDTNAFVCRKIDEGTCGFDKAEAMRSIAKSFRERALLQRREAKP